MWLRSMRHLVNALFAFGPIENTIGGTVRSRKSYSLASLGSVSDIGASKEDFGLEAARSTPVAGRVGAPLQMAVDELNSAGPLLARNEPGRTTPPQEGAGLSDGNPFGGYAMTCRGIQNAELQKKI
jgi:hypothetical protein